MSFKYIQDIPSVKEIFQEMPLPDELKSIKQEKDKELAKIFTRQSDKFLIIMGPCSADNEESVAEYIDKLAKLQKQVQDRILIVPRIYTNKPRTTGEGYKGMAHQPDPTEKPNMVEGIKAIRRMHMNVIAKGMIAADEMLYPENYSYLEDVLGYVAVGARSVENQQHRLTVSGLNVPVGMKNPTSGDLNVLLNSIQAAQMSHVLNYNGCEVITSGNGYAHAILRGAINRYGQNIPNYHYEDLENFSKVYLEHQFENPTIIVDVSHSNANKQYEQQPRIAMEVLNSMKQSEIVMQMVRGLMIESYLVEGKQKVSGGNYGQSITDACLGWDVSEQLVNEINEVLS